MIVNVVDSEPGVTGLNVEDILPCCSHKQQLVLHVDQIYGIWLI